MHYAPEYSFVSNPVLSLAPNPMSVSPLRIVSLVPSVTELIAHLGLAQYLVGRTGFCIHPAHLMGPIAKVGGTKAVNVDKIRTLAPTHIVVNVDENEKPTIDVLRQWVPSTVVTHPCAPEDNLALVDQLLTAFSPALACEPQVWHTVCANAAALKQQLNQRLDKLQAVQAQREPAQVLYLIWRDPWMTVARDTYISRMLDLIGWHTLPAVEGGDGMQTLGATRYPVLRGDEPWLAQVQRVLLSSEPYSFKDEHLKEVQNWLPHAVVQLVDGEMLSWYGSRAVQGLDYLAALSEGASVDGAAVCAGGGLVSAWSA
jgi:ABC-type Fe3+-hydroxamate transport system substrate-binding protein